MGRCARLLCISSVFVGCAPAYTCEDDSQCVWKGDNGTCEDNGYCSYPAPDCESTQRYGPHAGDRAGLCTHPDGGSTSDATAGGSIPTGEPPPPVPREGIWISHEEIAMRPTEGTAWEAVLALADEAPQPASLSETSNHNIVALANALVCVRLDDTARCDSARDALLEATTLVPENNAQTLAVQLLAYVVVADLLALDSADDTAVRGWLVQMRDADAGGRTLVETHEERPNNWGTQAGAVRAAIAVYLGEDGELQATADVFRGWLGARDVYAGFDYGALDWQSDPSAPVGINPVDATIDGHDVDGVIPDAQRDEGAVSWPPPGSGVAGYAALTGALALGVILHRRGHDVWNWEGAALGRAWQWHWDVAGYRPSGGRQWLLAIVDGAYGFSYPIDPGRTDGTSMALTAWTHP